MPSPRPISSNPSKIKRGNSSCKKTELPATAAKAIALERDPGKNCRMSMEIAGIDRVGSSKGILVAAAA